MEKSQSWIFEKKSWFGDIYEKVSKLSQNQTLIFFSKTALTVFFGFWPVSTKYHVQFEWNLFFRKICNFEIFDLEIVKKLLKLRFFTIFLTLHHSFSLILHIMIGGHDVSLFSYNLPVQSMYSCFFRIYENVSTLKSFF